MSTAHRHNLDTGCYMGLLCGTSADAVHGAIARFAGHTTELVSSLHLPLEASLRQSMYALGEAAELGEYARLDASLGELFAATARQLLRHSGLQRDAIVAIGSLGYTAWHRPRPAPPFSLQIADPNRIAWRTGITTVADFRRMDQAAGGEGAPITPAYHVWQFHKPGLRRAVLNLGGIANLTLLPGPEQPCVIGLDTGPANVLLDTWIRHSRGLPMDENGDWAAGGQPIPALLERLLQDEYFAAAAPKSTGPEHFNMDWLQQRLIPGDAADVQATLVQLTAETVGQALRQYAPDCQELLLCGGGVHNATVVQALSQNLGKLRLVSTAHYGVDPDYVEAVTCAWLARRRLLGHGCDPGTLATAAAPGAVLGAVYQRPQRDGAGSASD